LIKYLVALRPAYNQTQFLQSLEFSLQGAMSGPNFSGKLSQIERLVCISEERGQEGAASSAKKASRARGYRTHSGYNRTLFGYGRRGCGLPPDSAPLMLRTIFD